MKFYSVISELALLPESLSHCRAPTLMDRLYAMAGKFVMSGLRWRLGYGATVMTGIFVVKDVEPYSIVAGVPAILPAFQLPEAQGPPREAFF